jgi:hypothetical protein
MHRESVMSCDPPPSQNIAPNVQSCKYASKNMTAKTSEKHEYLLCLSV